MDMPRTNARGQGQGRGQFFAAESEDKILASRPACPRGLNITGWQHTSECLGSTKLNNRLWQEIPFANSSWKKWMQMVITMWEWN